MSGVGLGPRRWRQSGAPTYPGLSTNLLGAVYGAPVRDLTGASAVAGAPSLPYAVGPFGPGVAGSASSFSAMAFRNLAATNPASNSGVSVFAAVRINSSSEKGIIAGVNNVALSDAGFMIGVGATAPDATGNNLVGVRGGINYTTSGQAIGTGFHTIGAIIDGTNNYWYVDGVRVSTTGTGATWNSNSDAALVVGNHRAASSIQMTAGVELYFAAAWTRVLDHWEFAALDSDPFAAIGIQC